MRPSANTPRGMRGHCGLTEMSRSTKWTLTICIVGIVGAAFRGDINGLLAFFCIGLIMAFVGIAEVIEKAITPTKPPKLPADPPDRLI